MSQPMTALGRSKAEQRAEELLKSMISPEQYADWASNRAFDILGSDGRIYRIVGRSGGYRNSAIVDSNGVRANIWPSGLSIDADKAISLLLHMSADAETTWRVGCHDFHAGPTPTGAYL
jgi:hypothetical protein